jgi:dipeptidyl aminopeptidase/acylaminoacyl peptidase
VFQIAQNVSPDGRWLLFRQRGDQGIFDLWVLPLGDKASPTPFVQSAWNKSNARFSPDGRYVAYLSEEGGAAAIYVTPFPGPGEKMPILARRAQALRWTRGGEILFVSDDGHLVSVPVRTTPSLQVGPPVDLFALPEGKTWPSFDVTPDGARILAVVPEVNPSTLPLDVIVNWAPAAAR